MSLESVYFYRSPVGLPGLFDSLFGGFFLVKGIPLIGQLAAMVAFAAAGMSAYRARRQPHPWRKLSIGFSLGLFALLWLFLLQPWDEIFINLRHAQNWAQSGNFSFNAGTREEGTVETLPFLAVGLLAKLGVPIVEGGFVLGLLGGLTCLAVAYRYLSFWKLGRALPFALLAVAVFPPLAYNSAHGFGTLWFAAALLGAIGFLFFETRPRWGFALLAVLPLIRFEGIFASALFFAFWVSLNRPRWPRAMGLGVVVALPAILHAVIRWTYYGHIVPLPVQYKSSIGSLFFFAVGMRNLVADAIATHTLSLALFLFALRRQLRPSQIAVGTVLAACVLPYYLSGGDWFPSYWARYLFPLTFYLVLLAIGVARTAYLRSPRALATAAAFPALVFCVTSLWPISSSWKVIDHLFSHRRTLAMIHEPTIARGHYRIQNLSRLGEHLRRTTPPEARIGTSELATIAFFAQRPCVDFLGLINPEIAQSPLRPMPSLLRRFPYRSELPYLIFRRLRPDLLAKTQPEILYTFDFLIRDQIPQVRPYELNSASLFQALARWEKQLGGLVDPLYGGLGAIAALGYAPIVVQAGEDFTALYFVHARTLPEHLKALTRNGYQGGLISCTHRDGPCSKASAGQ